MKSSRIALVVVCGCVPFASTARAQMPTFLGPDLLTRGAGDIGTRSGSANDLRFFAGVSAVYDNGIQPASVDSAGHLVPVNALYGAEVSLGAYGQHLFKHAKLGLDYHGTFRHYNANSYWDGSDHQLALGYTYQKSQRVTFDFRQIAGSSSLGASFAGTLPTAFGAVVDPTTLLFDNRTVYFQSTADMTYERSLRTSFTVGGDFSTVGRQSSALIGVRTYGLHGSIQHRISQTTSAGVTYNHMHYDFPQGFGESDIDTAQGFVERTFAMRWKVLVRAGIYHSSVIGLQQVALDPFLAALLGVPTITQAFYRTNWLPNVDATVTRSFMHAALSFNYARSISPGNGVYLASRQELASGSYSYTGIRKWTFRISGNYGRLSALGQGLPPYKQESGGAGFTYALTQALYATGGYDIRHYEIAENSGFRRTGSRVTLGLSFSPGDIPLSFH